MAHLMAWFDAAPWPLQVAVAVLAFLPLAGACMALLRLYVARHTRRIRVG